MQRYNLAFTAIVLPYFFMIKNILDSKFLKVLWYVYNSDCSVVNVNLCVFFKDCVNLQTGV